MSEERVSWREYRSQMLIDDGRNALQIVRDKLMRAVNDIDSSINRYDNESDNLSEKARILNTTINQIVNIYPNLRLDLLAESQAQLTQHQAVLGNYEKIWL